MEEALYETTILRQFAGLSLERIPDETTILNFRRLLEKHELAAGILGVINGYLGDRGLLLRQGTIVDATLIHAPSSTKNKDGKRDIRFEGGQVIWQIAARRSTYKLPGKRSLLYRMKRKIERAKAQARAKVEHPFRVIKRQFGYTKVRFRGLAKKHCSVGHAIRSFKSVDGAPALLTNTGEVCP